MAHKVLYFIQGHQPTAAELVDINYMKDNDLQVNVRTRTNRSVSRDNEPETSDFVAGSVPSQYRDTPSVTDHAPDFSAVSVTRNGGDHVLDMSGNPIRSGETHVFLLAGQSNMVGWRPNNNSADFPGGTLQYGHSDDTLKPASDPLDHWDESAGNMGLARQFVIDYTNSNPNVSVLLIPRADGGTSFQANHWNPGNTHYNSAVQDTNQLMSDNPTFKFKGVLWHQGESDHVAPDEYVEALYGMMYQMRKDIATMTETTPFILGQVHEDNTLYNVLVNLAVTEASSVFPHTVVVDTQDLPLSSDSIHWDGDELDIMGSRYAVALADAPHHPVYVPEVGGNHYLLGAHSPQHTTISDEYPMTLAGTGVTGGVGYVQPDGVADGLVTQTPDADVQTQCYVVRVAHTTIIGGTLEISNTNDGSSCYFIDHELRYNARGLPTQAVVDNTLVANEWIFVAISEKIGSTQLFRGGEGEHATNVGFTRGVSSRLSVLGSSLYQSSAFSHRPLIAEYIAFPGVAKTLPELRAIYERSKIRMAARGITLK